MVTKPCGALESPMATITKITRRRHENPPHGVASVKEWFNYVTATRNEGEVYKSTRFLLAKLTGYRMAEMYSFCHLNLLEVVNNMLNTHKLYNLNLRMQNPVRILEFISFGIVSVNAKNEEMVEVNSMQGCRPCQLSTYHN